MNKVKLLIAEDSNDMRELLLIALSREGRVECHVAEDGVIALAKYFKALTGINDHDAIGKPEPFTHILLDIAMPKIDGFTVCEWIRKVEREMGKSPTSIASYTAHVEEIEDSLLLKTVGFDAYFRKPGTSEQLAEMVENWLLREIV